MYRVYHAVINCYSLDLIDWYIDFNEKVIMPGLEIKAYITKLDFVVLSGCIVMNAKFKHRN